MRTSSPKRPARARISSTPCARRLGEHPHVGEMRGKGLMCAVEFVKDRDTKAPFAPEEQVGARIHAEAVARGLFSRVRGDVFVLAPPFVTPDDLLDRIGEILTAAAISVSASVSARHQTFLAFNRPIGSSVRRGQARGAYTPAAAHFYGGPHMPVNNRFPLVPLGLATALVWPRSHPRLRPRPRQELPLQLYWVDRTGKAIEPVGPPGSYRGPDVTADGRVAVHQHDRLGGDIWLVDTKGQMTRFTTDATGTQENSSPIFSPDGTRVVFASLRNGKWGLYLKGVSGGREELLYESGSRKMPMAWSPDGQYIVYWVASGAGQWVMPVKNPSAARPLHDRQNSHAQISPDGKWVAFNSQNQIYVKPFPSGEGLWKVSPDNGGAFARWRGDSKELYFLSRISFGQMMAVDINATGSTLQPGKPRVLFDSRYVNLNHPSNYHTYSVAADGQRFLIPRIASYSLTVFDRGGKAVRTLDRGVYTSPAWSPDGTRVAAVKDTQQVWVVDANSGKSIQLAANQPEDVVTGLSGRLMGARSPITSARSIRS